MRKIGLIFLCIAALGFLLFIQTWNVDSIIPDSIYKIQGHENSDDPRCHLELENPSAKYIGRHFWDRDTITYSYMVNDSTEMDRLNHMERWIRIMDDSLDVEFIQNPNNVDSDVDIAFLRSYRAGGKDIPLCSCAYVGMQDQLSIPDGNWTLNMAWMESDYRVDSHEWGHVLGLSHEQHNPVNGLEIDTAKAFAHFSNRSKEWVLQYVHQKDLSAGYEAGPFDCEANMLYPMDCTYMKVKDCKCDTRNRKFSKVEWDFLFSKYGKESAPKGDPEITGDVTELFEEFPWLEEVVMQGNCESVAVYNKWERLIYATPKDSNGNYTLFRKDGTIWCSLKGSTCFDHYRLTGAKVSKDYSCTISDNPVVPPVVTEDIYEISILNVKKSDLDLIKSCVSGMGYAIGTTKQ